MSWKKAISAYNTLHSHLFSPLPGDLIGTHSTRRGDQTRHNSYKFVGQLFNIGKCNNKTIILQTIEFNFYLIFNKYKCRDLRNLLLVLYNSALFLLNIVVHTKLHNWPNKIQVG